MKKLTRKEFLATSAAALVGVVAVGTGCAGGDTGGSDPGDDDDDDAQTTTPTPTPSGTTTPTPVPTPTPAPTPSGDCMANGTTVTIVNPHNHTMVVSAQDVINGTEMIYDITGGATHGHTVTLTAAHFAQLQMNFQVIVQASQNGHGHQVTVRCA